jgi:predicted transposase YbfD/YdcC
MTTNTETRGILDLLVEEFSKCSDNRDVSRVHYSLTEILFLVFCGLISSCETYQDIVDYGEMKIDWLKKYLPYSNGIPSHDTINRALSLLNKKELSNVLLGISSYEITLKTGDVLHLDGKLLSGSATVKEMQTKKSAGGKQALHTVNLFCSSLRSCIASVPVADKGGEKQVFLNLLEVLDLRGTLLTLDANFCDTEVIRAMQEAEVDYVIGLKNNQSSLRKAAEELLHLQEKGIIEKHIGKEERGHGRIEKRDCKVVYLENLPQEIKAKYEKLLTKWKGVATIIQIEASRTIIATDKIENETRYYICSQKIEALRANQIIRAHWTIENNLHWVLDMALGEDKNRNRNHKAAFALSIIRKIALNKLANFDDPKTSIKRKMRKCLMSNDYLENILGIS